MTARTVDVVHVLVPRRVKGEVQFLLFAHPRWRAADTGRGLLALPAKKFSGGGRSRPGPLASFDGALGAVLREDLGLPGDLPHRRLPGARFQLTSPALRVPTRY